MPIPDHLNWLMMTVPHAQIRFLQPYGRVPTRSDVPSPGDPQSLNRYAYAGNNPLRYTDPSGHFMCADSDCILGWNDTTQRPFVRKSVPQVVNYIHQEMIQNAQGDIAQAINTAIKHSADDPILYGWANVLWGSQVMDARIKKYVPPWLAKWLGNRDHKQIIYSNTHMTHKGWSGVGSHQYYYDIWSNIHYGYVGAASGFNDAVLAENAGLEQIGSTMVNHGVPRYSPQNLSLTNGFAPNAGWDETSDLAAIMIGVQLWQQYELTTTPADIALTVIESPYLKRR